MHEITKNIRLQLSKEHIGFWERIDSQNEARCRLLIKAQCTERRNGSPTILELVVIHKFNNHQEPDSIICMDSICPHSGGPLHLGDIEEIVSETGPTRDRESFLICPWHAYRFSCQTGESLDCDDYEANVYPAKILSDNCIDIEFPFSVKIISCTAFEYSTKKTNSQAPEPEFITSAEPMKESLQISEQNPTTLVAWAIRILQTSDPSEKVRLTFEAAKIWKEGDMAISHNTDPLVPNAPSRDNSMNHVAPSKAKRLGKAGSVASRIAILHAVANIEQWAIDLAWDIIARFHSFSVTDVDGNMHSLPRAFFSDFVKVASDEARHYSYLVERLGALGSSFGELPVHGGLWDSASATSHDLLSRLAIVHMVHEARGLDVNPQTIAKFERAGDMESVEKLSIIHSDEITHVACGQRWFSWICALSQKDRYSTFHELVSALFRGPLKPPFNEEDRLKAGLDPQYYLPLSG